MELNIRLVVKDELDGSGSNYLSASVVRPKGDDRPPIFASLVFGELDKCPEYIRKDSTVRILNGMWFAAECGGNNHELESAMHSLLAEGIAPAHLDVPFTEKDTGANHPFQSAPEGY